LAQAIIALLGRTFRLAKSEKSYIATNAISEIPCC